MRITAAASSIRSSSTASEAYHQDFLTLHPTYPYIVFNDLPKVDALKRMFPDLYRQKPVPSRVSQKWIPVLG